MSDYPTDKEVAETIMQEMGIKADPTKESAEPKRYFASDIMEDNGHRRPFGTLVNLASDFERLAVALKESDANNGQLINAVARFGHEVATAKLEAAANLSNAKAYCDRAKQAEAALKEAQQDHKDAVAYLKMAREREAKLVELVESLRHYLEERDHYQTVSWAGAQLAAILSAPAPSAQTPTI